MVIFIEFMLTLIYQLPVTYFRYSLFVSSFRYSVKKTFLLLLTVWLSFNVVAVLSGSYDTFSSACNFRFIIYAAMAFLSFWLIKEHPGKQIFTISLFSVIVYMTSSFSLLAEIIFFPDSSTEHLVFKLFAFTFGLILILPVFIKFIYIPLTDFLHDCDVQIWNIIWLPSTLGLLLPFIVVFPWQNMEHLTCIAAALRFIISLSTLIMDISIILLLKNTKETMQNAFELKAINQQLYIEQYQYQKMQKNMEEARRFRHDQKHQIALIFSILEDTSLSEHERLDKLSSYFTKYYGAMPVPEDMVYCSNYPLNLLLNYYASKCREASIHIDLHIKLADISSIDDTDLCVIIGNILLNAYEAVTPIQDSSKNIDITISHKNNSLLIYVENGFDGILKPSSRTNPFESTKHKGEGVGLTSIISITKRYHGTCSFGRLAENPKVFCSKVYLPLSAH